jgi:hypothetical protein
MVDAWTHRVRIAAFIPNAVDFGLRHERVHTLLVHYEVQCFGIVTVKLFDGFRWLGPHL